MTTYSVRCRNSKCRHRRVTKTHPLDYKVEPKCGQCGSRKGWRIEGRAYNQRDLCYCNGVDIHDGRHFPHNTTHPLCDKHVRGFYNQAKARGISDEDIPFELTDHLFETSDVCPF